MKKYKLLSQLLTEAEVMNQVPWVLHHHADPRNTGAHYDLRILDPYKKNELISFAIPASYDLHKKVPDKMAIYRTRPHPEHWLKKETYRIKVLEEGEAAVLVSSPKYFKLDFKGKRRLKGIYILFKKSGTKRNDVWMMVKTK